MGSCLLCMSTHVVSTFASNHSLLEFSSISFRDINGKVENAVTPSCVRAESCTVLLFLLEKQERILRRVRNMAHPGADAKSQSVAKVLGRIMVGAGIALAGVSVGTGISVGLYFVGRGIERHGTSVRADTEAPALGTDTRTNEAENRSK